MHHPLWTQPPESTTHNRAGKCARNPSPGANQAPPYVLIGTARAEWRLRVSSPVIGVRFGCFARKIDGDSWFTWWFHHLPGPSSSPRRTHMIPVCLKASPKLGSASMVRTGGHVGHAPRSILSNCCSESNVSDSGKANRMDASTTH